MRKSILILLLVIVACSPQQLNTPQGQLFCQLATPSGAVIAPIVVQQATDKAGATGGALAVIVTNALAMDVAQICSQAAKNAGAVTGTPVPPPASVVVPAVPVTLPKNTSVKTGASV